MVSETLLAADPKASILILEAGTRVKTKDFGLWENYLITNKLPYEAYWDLPYPQKEFPGENNSIGQFDIPFKRRAPLHVWRLNYALGWMGFSPETRGFRAQGKNRRSARLAVRLHGP